MMEAGKQIEQVSDSNDKNVWITVAEVCAFERISRRECYYRMDHADSHRLIWKPKPGKGLKPGRLIYAPSMSFDAQQRWSASALKALVEPKPAAETAVKTGQLSLLPRTKIDREIAALGLPESMKKVVVRRYNIVDLCLNHNWKSENYPSKRAYLNALAKANQTSARSIQRWTEKYRETGKLISLADELPGPEPYGGDALDDDMKAHLQGCWVFKKLNVRQCYQSLIRYLEGKQNSPGCRVAWLYKIPSYPTVARFIRSLPEIDHAARCGPEALKAACGHIDRSFEDLASGEMWCTDEWNVDAGCYEDQNARRYYRPWIIALMDVRSKYVLHWVITRKPRADVVLDLVEQAVRRYGRPDYFYADKGGHFRGRLGRHFTVISREKLLDPATSILEQLGTIRCGPGREKNPRGNPIERRHRIFADAARLLPTWSGANTEERPDQFDEAWEMHKQWIRGKTPATGLIPLSKISAWFSEVVEEYNHAPSDANGVHGLSPAAAYREFSTDSDRERRRVSEDKLQLIFAESYPQRTIQKGGIIELRDGKRYSHPLLILIQGQTREVVRLRDDHSKIYVLPQRKGEETIIAPRRERIGTNDPENLARAMELQRKLQKVVGLSTKPLELRPEAFLPEGEAKALPAQELEVLLPEEPWKAQEERALPRLHDIAPITIEEPIEMAQAEAPKKVQVLDFADLVY